MANLRSPVTRSIPPWLLPAIATAGVICRLAQYLSRRSFWEDESFIVLQLKLKTASQLLGPLADLTPPQAAPPLWLLAQWAMVVLFGANEYALRAIPLLAGIAALAVMALLARRLLTPIAATAVVALFAFSDRLIWHAAEVKPYSSDVLVAALLLWTALAETDAIRRLAWTSLAAAVGVWLSYPAVFVFAGVSLALLPSILAGDRPRRLAIWAGCNALVAASFAALFLLVISRQQNVKLDDYWADCMPDYGRPLTVPFWLVSRLAVLGSYAAEYSGPALLVLIAIGVGYLWRRNSERLGLLLLPLAATIVAAMAHRYPLDGRRLNLFLLPALVVLAGFGMEWVLERWPAICRHAVLAALALSIPQMIVCTIALVQPRTRAAMRPAVQYVLAHRQPGEGVYTLNYHQTLCYWPEGEPPPYFDKETRPAGRFWVLISYRPGRERASIDERLARVRRVAQQVQPPHVVDGDGGAVYLFEAK